VDFSPFFNIDGSENFTNLLSRLFSEDIDISIFYRKIKYFFRDSVNSFLFWKLIRTLLGLACLSNYFRISNSYFCKLICSFRFFINIYYIFFFHRAARVSWFSAYFLYIIVWVSAFSVLYSVSTSFFSVSCTLIWLLYAAINRVFIIYLGFFTALFFASL
jgi:hypothetical protein